MSRVGIAKNSGQADFDERWALALELYRRGLLALEQLAASISATTDRTRDQLAHLVRTGWVERIPGGWQLTAKGRKCVHGIVTCGSVVP